MSAPKTAVVRCRLSIARPSHRICAVSQLMCVGCPLPSQIMCAGKGPLLRVGPFIIARRYTYEWQANVVMAKNTGCTQEQIDAMTSEGPPTGLDNKTALVMLATDEMTKSGTLTDATLQRLRDTYDDVICRKIILIIAWFNLLARFLNGCRVPLETGDKLGNRTSPLG